MIFMKTIFKTILMLVVLACGILYVDLTVNSLLGTPKILIIEHAKEQISEVLNKTPGF